MQLKLNGFEEKKSTKTRIEESIASNLTLKGIEHIAGFSDILKDIFANYELEKGIFRLKDETCIQCKSKLKRKGTYPKEITLPGGVLILLTFHQYSCTNCKAQVDRKLGSWFTNRERYSSNVKSDAVRLYLGQLSSYDAVRKELCKIYQKNFSKRTIRRWLRSVGNVASNVISLERNFSGHFIYDEEYLKIYLGDVGKKGAKLQRIEVFLLLFRDAVTKKVIVMLADSLDMSSLYEYWKEFTKWTIKNGLPFLTLTTDGKREYDTMANELNKEFHLDVRHGYCVFHFKKNLFEVSNKHFFGVRVTKKELPHHVKNQISLFDNVIDANSKDAFKNELSKLEHQIQTFIPPLRDQIKRLRTYEKNYMLHIEFPYLATTNLCEQWFGQTKPEKIKHGYKTKNGVLNVINGLAVKKTDALWKESLNISKDIQDATELLISALIYKTQFILPA